MARALAVARRGEGATSPNPKVGAVLAVADRILAEGWHRRFGAAHAERHLLARWGGGKIPTDAVLYVTLEPCAHTGKTGPCAERLLDTSIQRFVVAIRDPNPRVRGRGIRRLRHAGREVRVGLLGREARALNHAYLLSHREGRASITVKLATSLDGRLADAWGGSQWITGPVARNEGIRRRRVADAIVVGRGTADRDDPRLDARGGARSSPSRILLDASLRSDPACRMARLWRAEIAPLADYEGTSRGNWIPPRRAGGIWRRRPRLIAAAAAAPPARRAARFRNAGWEIWELPARDGRIDADALAVRAGREGLLDLLVEAGPTLAASLLETGPVDRLLLFLAPLILGGPAGWTATLPPRRITRPIRGRPLADPVRIGGDLLWEIAGPRGEPLVPARKRRK
ncbi:MAG: bifunctional diaminohydroxyphosphoribosylaminopyrimidine deaminase/5-amino-6-(5-phosphoribosylamino)uracil reductase RibD [Candidatus Eisenbacteria bacterium]|nr:bifunctional diaminohydroxyphosphoribosylaminopyrimidine deaminase/5-amino-6-(5-phosphoribosylamino)uracil reductase RibD [Candidatus Latescibacterota bacterium]MBD3302300.1 bifunctional diaminohydroxyphosphoribosylaminopyrimidine deaminase/5-amino-6-(5-phosphoribosylamino)uracil reductase RibD [Candidatus Eisenbacteria bacterium]